MDNEKKLELIAKDVLQSGQERGIVKDFVRIGMTLFVNFIGRRRGCLWQSQMCFDEEGNINGVSSPYGSPVPSYYAKEISRKMKE